LKPLPLVIDTNLLVLFVVGTASRHYIKKHKRLTEFIPEDFDALVQIISNAPSVFVTPNTLTETSNLAGYIGEPARTEVFRVLQNLVATATEEYVPSRKATERKEFFRLGLTDSALIEACSTEAVLVTTDLNLYLAVEATGAPAINFNQIRDRHFTVGGEI
jgi:hypothetical protein